MPFKMFKLKRINMHLGVDQLRENGIKNTVLHFRPFHLIPFQRLYEKMKKKKKRMLR